MNHSKPATRPLTYLIVINNLSFLYSHFWNLAVAIRDAGWEVTIAANQDVSAARVVESGMMFVSLPPVGGMGAIGRVFRYYGALTFQLHRLRPTAAHFIYLENVLLGGIASRLARIPAVIGAITGLGTLFAESRPHYKAVRLLVMAGIRWGFGNHNSVLVFENVDDKSLFINRKAISESRTALIPGAGVPADEIVPSDAQNQKPIILFASRMIRSKGAEELVHAAEEIYNKGIDLELWLVGSIDSTNPTCFRAEEIGNFEKLDFVRYLAYRTDVADLMKQADVFCLPTYYREGLPRVLIEACAAGKPIVTTNVPGCREIVHNEVNGLIVPPRDHAALVSALSILLRDKDLRHSMGKEARRIFEERYTLNAFFLAFDKCYRTLDVPLVLHRRTS